MSDESSNLGKALFAKENLCHFQNKKKYSVPTDSTRSSEAKQDHITALSMVQQFDKLMQHDGDGRDTHAML